jgi:hypothetical protein
MVMMLVAVWRPAQGAVILVTTLQQKIDNTIPGCSLQEAIYAANLQASLAIDGVNPDGTDHFITTSCVPGTGNDTIVLPLGGAGFPETVFPMTKIVSDAHNYLGPTATPLIFSTITIEANGAVLQGGGAARAFVVGQATVMLPGGGSVSGTGFLIIRNAYIKDFVAHAGNGACGGGGGMGAGGAIYVTVGTLTIENSTFASNSAIGGDGGLPCGSFYGGGGGGFGGLGGRAGHHTAGGGGGGAVGSGGDGGPTTPDLVAAGGGGGGTATSGGSGSSTVPPVGGVSGMLCGGTGGTSNQSGSPASCAGGGGGGGGITAAQSGSGGGGGYGGGGGGSNNGGTGGAGGFGGGGGGGQDGGNGGFGGGGGAGSDSLFQLPANGTGGLFGANATASGGGGGAGLGGAIYNEGGSVVIRNSTFMGNSVSGGAGGNPIAVGAGGAIFSLNGLLAVKDATISGNSGSAGGLEVFANATASFALNNTIIASNGLNECVAASTGAAPNMVQQVGAANLIMSNAGCLGVVTTADPQLGPLQYNQGGTPTMAIGKTSPAFNTGDLGTSLPSDQRGQSRPAMNGVPDIGAFELCLTGPPLLQLPCVIPAGNSGGGVSLTVQATGRGTTTPAPGPYGLAGGSVIALTATADPHSVFLNWTGPVTDPSNPNTTVVLTEPQQAVTANFAPPNPMTLDRRALIFTAVNTTVSFTADTAPQIVRMTQSGPGAVTWTVSSNQPWLTVVPTSGTGSATLTIATKFVPGLASTQLGAITITLTGAANAVGPINVTLNTIAPAAVTSPFGSFDTPSNGLTGVAGSIAVTGWALDAVQVTRVTVCRDAVAPEVAPVDPNCAGHAEIYIGDAVFVDGARPDVQADYPALPLNSRAGWGYLLLTNFLPNLGDGTYTLRAYAFDAEALPTALGVKTITCNNGGSLAPFGAIDVPAQGAVTTGLVGNTGWVLAQRPNFADPPDGGTVNVFVDGSNVGSPGLWNARPDLTGLFPAAQYPGIAKALGIFGLDTTTLSNGVHTIFWLATGAPGGGTSGIGSEFFISSNGADVLNSAAATSSSPAATVIAARSTLDMPAAATSRIVSSETLASEIAALPSDLREVQGRRGFNLDLPLKTYAPSSGAIDVQAEELDRVELHLGSTGQHQYTGYLQTAGGLKPLPVGSSLDASTGTFTWMPGVGFYGTYHLTFVRWSGGTAVSRQDVLITLNAKGSNRNGPQTIIDAPKAGASVGSPFFVGGWAADLNSTVDTGVNTVHVWAYPLDARGKRLEPIFIGPAIYGGARPDVAAVYGDRFENSGYGIIVNGLAPGTYDIAVFAYSTVVGNFTAASVARVTLR